MEVRACAFTGHRPKKLPWRYDEGDPACVALKNLLAEKIGELAEQGVRHYLSGGAEGTDMYCSLAVLALRDKLPDIKLHCILPCKSQAKKWSLTSQKTYYEILDQADSIVYVNREETRACMLERNRFLVAYSSILLAVHNGDYRSGTAATVRYARKLGREIYIVHPSTLEISHEDTKLSLGNP